MAAATCTNEGAARGNRLLPVPMKKSPPPPFATVLGVKLFTVLVKACKLGTRKILVRIGTIQIKRQVKFKSLPWPSLTELWFPRNVSAR